MSAGVQASISQATDTGILTENGRKPQIVHIHALVMAEVLAVSVLDRDLILYGPVRYVSTNDVRVMGDFPAVVTHFNRQYPQYEVV